jgi:hypothetical protein
MKWLILVVIIILILIAAKSGYSTVAWIQLGTSPARIEGIYNQNNFAITSSGKSYMLVNGQWIQKADLPPLSDSSDGWYLLNDSNLAISSLGQAAIFNGNVWNSIEKLPNLPGAATIIDLDGNILSVDPDQWWILMDNVAISGFGKSYALKADNTWKPLYLPQLIVKAYNQDDGTKIYEHFDTWHAAKNNIAISTKGTSARYDPTDKLWYNIASSKLPVLEDQTLSDSWINLNNNRMAVSMFGKAAIYGTIWNQIASVVPSGKRWNALNDNNIVLSTDGIASQYNANANVWNVLPPVPASTTSNYDGETWVALTNDNTAISSAGRTFKLQTIDDPTIDLGIAAVIALGPLIYLALLPEEAVTWPQRL